MNNYAFDDEEIKEESAKGVPGAEETKKKRPPFAYWEIGGEEYKLKLTTATVCQLEDRFKCNLMNILSNGIPPLNIMLSITQCAMKTWRHGIKYEHVQAMFDKYLEEGGTQLSFMTDIIMPIYSVSGFFSEDQQTAMDQKLEEVKEVM